MHNFIMSTQEGLETSLGRLRKAIEEKEEQPIVGTRITLDWKAGEIILSSQFADVGLIDSIVNLQREAGKQRIGCFYTFFIMQKALRASLTAAILDQQTILLTQKQSKYHTLKAFISMREHLLAKINKYSGNQAKALFEDVDDIRFLNFEIINGIQKWKEEWRVQGHPEPVFYEAGTNYLLKISNDNADMINLANFKKTKFISPPNPFFLTEDGNLQGMTGKQKQDIADCMEAINKERAIDLRMAVSGEIFLHKPRTKPKATKNVTSIKKDTPMERSFVSLAKNELLSGKEEQIRKIYKINRSLQSTKNKAQLERISNINIIKVSNEQRDQQKLKMYSSQKRLKSNSNKNPKQVITKDANPVSAKLVIKKISFPQKYVEESKISKTSNGIRNEISKFVKDLQSQSPVKKREVREMKPKIKLIQEKNTVVVEEQMKAIISMTASNVRPLSLKNSTFYKKIEPIAEEAEDAPMPTTLKKQSKRSLSQSNFYHKEPIQQKEKQVIIKPQVNLQSSILSRQADSKSQIRTMSNRIKNLTIINIYKGKKGSKKHRNSSLSAIRAQESHVIPTQRPIASSFITEIRDIQPKIDSSKFTATLERHKAANNNEISKLSQQLQKKSLKSKRNEEILQEKQARRLQAQKELQLKSIIITELQQKIKQLEGLRATNRKKTQPSKIHSKEYERSRKMRQIESKILKDKITSQEEKFIAQRELELKLKQQALRKELKKNLKELQADTIKKRKEYQKQILQEEHRLKEMERQINKEKSKYKEIESELQQKRLKEKLLRKIMEEKEEAAAKHYQTEIEVEKALEIERGLREKMERQSLQLLQEQKRKMEALYQEMIHKNKLIQDENRRKMAQLDELDEKRAREMQKVKELEEQFRKTVTKEKPQAEPQEIQSQPKQAHNIQELKLSLKKELLEQILAKQRRQEQEQRQQQQRRRQRLKRIEEEVARTLKAQEESLQRENAQFLRKIEQLKEMALIPSTHSPPEMEQSQQVEPKQQKPGPQREPASSIQNPVTFQLKQAGTDDNNQVQIQMKQLQLAVEPPKQDLKPQQANIQNKENAESKPILSPKIEKLSQHPQQMTELLPSQNPTLQNHLQQQSKSLEDQKQQQDLRQRYKFLSKYLKKTKLIIVQPGKTGQFLDSFISSLQKPVREMLPWNRFDLQRIIGTKEVDIFEHSIGWLQGDKYHLIGSQQCIQAIGRKYGAVPIHQVFIFDKNNPYQKQYLTKKMKTFESIGFVFQKKLQEGSKYSIRFVVKLPRDVFKIMKKEPEERVKSPPEHTP